MAAPTLRLTLTESNVNVANNTSTVTAKLELYGNGETFSGDAENGYITIDGTRYNFKHSFSTSQSWQYLASASKTITHNSDGTKTISVSAYFDTSWSYYGALSTSASKTLTTIARASGMSLNASSVNAGSSLTVSISSASSSFKHAVAYKLNSASSWSWAHSGYIAAGTSSYAFTMPMSICNSITSSTSAKFKIRLYTYNSSNSVIGYKESGDLTVNVPTSVVPTVSNSVSEGNPAISSKFSLFVQGKSQLKVAVSASSPYGGSIKSTSTTVAGLSYAGSSFTSGVITGKGVTKVVTTVTDSRGRTASYTRSVEIYGYADPSISAVSAEQCNSNGVLNPDGVYTKLHITGNISDVNGTNTKALNVKWGPSGGTMRTKAVPINWAVNNDVILDGTNGQEAFHFEVTLTDKLSSVMREIDTGATIMTMTPGAEKLIIHKPTEVHGDLNVDGLSLAVDQAWLNKWSGILGG